MTPGAWGLIAAVAACVLVGCGALIYELWKLRIPWKPLGFLSISYYSQDMGLSPQWLGDAVNQAINALVTNTKWPSLVVAGALRNFKVYVFADVKYAGMPGISGYEKDGVLGVNRRLTTLCHELGHLCQERIDRVVDYEHAQWQVDGIDKAERAFSQWLSEH